MGWVRDGRSAAWCPDWSSRYRRRPSWSETRKQSDVGPHMRIFFHILVVEVWKC